MSRAVFRKDRDYRVFIEPNGDVAFEQYEEFGWEGDPILTIEADDFDKIAIIIAQKREKAKEQAEDERERERRRR